MARHLLQLRVYTWHEADERAVLQDILVRGYEEITSYLNTLF